MWLVKSYCWNRLYRSVLHLGICGIGQDCLKQMVMTVFLCLNSTRDNDEFLKGIKQLVKTSGQKLKICYEYMNRGDRWMQVCTNQLSAVIANTCLSRLSNSLSHCPAGWAWVWIYWFSTPRFSCSLGLSTRWKPWGFPLWYLTGMTECCNILCSCPIKYSVRKSIYLYSTSVLCAISIVYSILPH